MEAMNCSHPNILVNSDPSSRDKQTQPDVYSDSEEYIDKQDGMAKDYLDAGDFLNKFVKDIEGLF